MLRCRQEVPRQKHVSNKYARVRFIYALYWSTTWELYFRCNTYGFLYNFKSKKFNYYKNSISTKNEKKRNLNDQKNEYKFKKGGGEIRVKIEENVLA